MSKCISIKGEYSEHEPSYQEFVCGRCFEFDEDAAVAEVESLRQQLAARDAVIEQARGSVKGWRSDLTALAKVRRDAILEILTAAPVSVLAEHDARLLEDVADSVRSRFEGSVLAEYECERVESWLRKRAAEYRKGAGQ